jgi:hypothetical protein
MEDTPEITKELINWIEGMLIFNLFFSITSFIILVSGYSSHKKDKD